MINDATGRQSTPSLMADAFAHLSRLLETEIRLVRKELSEKITEAVRAVAILAVSAVLLLTALIIILQGIVELLVYFGMQPFAASFTVGIVIAIVGAIAIFIAMRSLKGSNLAPSRTVDQLGKDVHVLKDQNPMSVTEPSSADIERDAEQERAELVSTLGQLRENLKPENVVDEVMANAKVSVTELTDRMWLTARQHPLPATMIGLGVAMILGVGQTVRSRNAAKEHDWTDESRFPRGGSRTTAPQDSAALKSFRTRVGAAQDQASSLLHAAADQVSGAANRTATSAREGLNSVSRNAAMAQNTRSRTQITRSLSRLLDEQPLVLAALGIAVGAAIGAAIPSTDAESEWMGEASDQVKQAARDMAREQYSNLKETASHTLDEVKRNATEHGLSSDNLSGLVQDVGNTVKSAASQAGGQVDRTEASV